MEAGARLGGECSEPGTENVARLATREGMKRQQGAQIHVQGGDDRIC